MSIGCVMSISIGSCPTLNQERVQYLTATAVPRTWRRQLQNGVLCTSSPTTAFMARVSCKLCEISFIDVFPLEEGRGMQSIRIDKVFAN